MRLKFYVINDLLIILLVLYSFVFGGIMQFFIGVSPTIASFLICTILILFIFLKRKHNFNRDNFLFVLFMFLLMVYTVVVSIVNNQEIIKPSIYCLFFIIPFAIYSLFNNRGELQLFQIHQLKQVLLGLAIFQLPILVLQFYGFDFFMQFNNSGQSLRSMDFQFGSFFLKNDHALGYFLVANILYVWSELALKNAWQKILITIILIMCLVLANSKVSVLLGILALLYLFAKNIKYLWPIFLKIKYLILALLILSCFLTVYFELNFYIEVKEKFNYELALKWYELGVAGREHIIVVLLEEELLYFGHGAYSYFDIVKGKFNKTFRHFSQYIWFYYDLGIVGLGLLILYYYKIGNLLKQNKSSYSSFMIFGLILYPYFTIVTFDISFVLIYFLYKYVDSQKNSIHSIS